MIKLNDKECPYEEGMTVRSLMDKKSYSFSNIAVRINGKAIDKEKWGSTIINEGDDVKMIHIFAGG